MDKRLPTFFVIGASRSGTTFIYQQMTKHPQVYPSKIKDLFFFNRNYDKGLDWYADFFVNTDNYLHIGDFSMEYYMHPECAPRIKKHIKDAKIICSIREPVERVFGNYYWEQLTYNNVSRKAYNKMTFVEYAQVPKVFLFGDYYNTLKPYYEHFPRENILVLFYAELKQSPQKYIGKICDFLGLDKEKLPKLSSDKINRLRVPRIPFIATGYKLCERLKSTNSVGVVSGLRDNKIFNLIMFKNIEKDEKLFRESLPELWPLYHKNDGKLEEMLGVELPSTWKKFS